MIGTITLNPSVDRRYNLKTFEKNNIYRCNQYSATAGGKGINVTKVIDQLNEKVCAYGFLGGFSGDFINQYLKKKQIQSDFTFINGSTRSCINILSDDGDQVEILESGPVIGTDEIVNLMNKLSNKMDSFSVITISGSIPQGVNLDIYCKIINMANNRGVKTVLDTSKETLLNGISGRPYLVKPNKEELEWLIGNTINNEEQLLKACRQVLKMGARNIALSLGSKGMYFIGEKGSYRVTIPRVEAKNPVGSGDSTVAGFGVSLARELDVIDTLKLANACGVANAMEMETGQISLNNVKELMKRIEVSSIYYGGREIESNNF
ncbi:MAG: 1-phosphofructokinase [Firmicutes bacterium]|nr:1-phosphofructokinase [Bacillota bacterium]